MKHYNDTDYLCHYGVLGMKWGQRRVRINTQKAQKARRKGNTEKAKKFSSKAKKIEAKHRGRAGDKAYERVKERSTAKLFGQSMLMGTYGALKYQQAKAKGNTTGKAAVKGLLFNVGNNATSGVLAIAEPRVTAEYKKTKKSSK